MTDDARHPIQLEAMFFTRSSVIAVPGHEPAPGTIAQGPSNSIAVNKVPEKEGMYSATMRTTMNLEADKSQPYAIDMECVAFFHADDTLTEEEKLRGVHVTAHSVCYGAIREAVSWITGRQPYGGLQLGLSVLKPQKPAAMK